MIEVFKTSVALENEAKRLIAVLDSHLLKHHINFDLEDCDKIMRVENRNGSVQTSLIESILDKEGYLCEVMPD